MRNWFFHWFYKVFRRSENALRKPSLGNVFLIILRVIFEKGAPKSPFSTGFIRVSATRFCFLRNRVFHWFYKVFRRSANALRKPSLGNAFLIILRVICGKGAPKSSFSTGFIRVSATRFCFLRNRVFHWFYKVFRRSENALRKPSLGNAFDYFEDQFRKRGPKVFIFVRFYKVFCSSFADVPKRCLTNAFLMILKVTFCQESTFLHFWSP